MEPSTSREKDTALVIGPGGAKGILEIGALMYLFKNGFLKKMKYVMGVSVGAIIGLLLVVGYTINEVLTDSLNTSLLEMTNPVNIKDILSKFGILEKDKLRSMLAEKLKEKLGIIPSLMQLYLMTGIEFGTVSLDAGEEEECYNHHSRYPEMSCIDAVIKSLNIPYVFTKEDNSIDGALANPFPVDFFNDKDVNVIGITMRSGVGADTKDIISYSFKIVSSIIAINRKLRIERCKNNLLTIELKTDLLDTSGISFSSGDKHKMLNQGFEQCKAIIIDERMKRGESFRF